MAEEPDKVRTKDDRILPMSNAADFSDLPHCVVVDWVKKEERRSGSRMAAYEKVAIAAGASASWVRKFYKGSPEAKEPGWAAGWNLINAYERAIVHFDRLAETEEAEDQSLRRKINAATAVYLAMVESATGTATASTDAHANRAEDS